MRSFILIAIFAASLSEAAWNDYEEVRTLDLAAGGIAEVSIKAGAGSLDVTGVKGLEHITVRATIGVAEADAAEANEVIEKRMVLALVQNGDTAQLDAWFEDGFAGWNNNGWIALEVRIPEGLALVIDDGSGSIDVIDTRGDVSIEDGSGSIDVENVRELRINDGSGSIDIDSVVGDVSVVDGSGSISIEDVEGSVSIDDGSGSIKVTDVENDVIILDDGSGSVTIRDVQGSVEQET